MRIAKYVAFLKAIVTRFTDGKCPVTVEKIIKTLLDLINTIDYLADHFLLLHKIKAMEFSDPTLKLCEFISDFCKLLDITLNTILYLPKYFALAHEIKVLKKESRDSKENKEGKEGNRSELDTSIEDKKKECKAIAIDLFKYWADIPVLLYLLFIIYYYNFS